MEGEQGKRRTDKHDPVIPGVSRLESFDMFLFCQSHAWWKVKRKNGQTRPEFPLQIPQERLEHDGIGLARVMLGGRWTEVQSAILTISELPLKGRQMDKIRISLGSILQDALAT